MKTSTTCSSSWGRRRAGRRSRSVRLLGYNRDLDLFPSAVVDRILVEPDFSRSRAGALLLDLGLKILCSSSRKNGPGVSAARLGIEAVLDAYEGLYDRLGGALSPVAWTISRSGFLTAGDLARLLRLALSVPGVDELVRVAARDLADFDSSWAERNLFEGEDDLAEGLPSVAADILKEAALDQLAPLDALDYLVGRDAGQFEGSSPPRPLARRGTLRRIAGRAGDDELFRWLRIHAGSDTSRSLVSVLSTRAHAGLLERLVRSESIEAGFAVAPSSSWRAPGRMRRLPAGSCGCWREAGRVAGTSLPRRRRTCCQGAAPELYGWRGLPCVSRAFFKGAGMNCRQP